MAFGFSYSFKLPATPPTERLNGFMEKHKLSAESSNEASDLLYTKSEFSYNIGSSALLVWFHFGTYIRFRPAGNQVMVSLSNKFLSGLMIVILLIIFGFFLLLPGETTSIDVGITLFLMLCVYIASGLRLLASGWYLKRKLKEM